MVLRAREPQMLDPPRGARRRVFGRLRAGHDDGATGALESLPAGKRLAALLL
jgi:hypothetical protein